MLLCWCCRWIVVVAVVVGVLLMLLLSTVDSAPLPTVKRAAAALPSPVISGRVRSDIEVPPPEIVRSAVVVTLATAGVSSTFTLRFMRRFGYLEPGPADAEALYHESAIVEAIKNVQKYGALRQTGKLDNATLELFSKPRCGVPDIEGIPYYLASSTQRSRLPNDTAASVLRQKRFVVGAPTWKKRRLRYFIANWSLKIPQTRVERDIARALALWAQHSGLQFERVNDTAADIIVGFGSRYHGDNYPFDGPGNILAHAFYPYELGSWGGDVHFDEDENWLENSTVVGHGVDFYAVAAHEIGHSLGLAHSPHHNSIMFPYYKGPGAGTTLDYDDTMAMYEIYLSKRLEDDDEDITAMAPITTTSTTASNEILVDITTHNSLAPTFKGDYESITEYKNRYAFNTTPATPTTELAMTSTTLPVPQTTTKTLPAPRTTTKILRPRLTQPAALSDICRGSFDAVSVLNGSLYIFKNEFVYRLTPQYTIMQGYPLSIYEMFPFLNTNIKSIDAAYQRYDGAGIFFTGASYWVFSYANSTNPIPIEDSPKPLSSLIANVQRVDAVMLWPKNNYTYIFAGAKFWRYNDRLRALDIGYPKSMRRWPGIPPNIDAAATLQNGKTYFFKDNLYWLYDNMNVRPERGYPRRASTAWLNCAMPTRTPLRNYNTTVDFIPTSALALVLSAPLALAYP